jgi:hypothetical protein
MSTSDEGTRPDSSQNEPAWYEGAVGWLPVSRAFIDRELGKPEPDYRSFADRLADYSAAERHAGWIGVAQSAPTRMGRTRAYIEALHNDPDPTSVAWSWLDGDFDLMERVEHVLSPDDEHTPAMVETVRNRVGSIIDLGGGDLTTTVADVDQASNADVADTAAAADANVAQAELEPASADPDAAQDVAPAQDVTPAQEAPAGAVAQPVAEQPASASWLPTHFVPAGGMAAWEYPDPSQPPRVILSAGLALVVDGSAGEWALVRAVNGWRGWVDGRRLTTRP